MPHAVGIDEPQVVDRALRILHTGDWNPHIFDYPTLVIYLHAVVAILRFLWGALNGEWASLDAFSITAVYRRRPLRRGDDRRGDGVADLPARRRAGSARRVALLAAAQMAVRPLHVRESHFILTDVPMTALTTLAVWLSVRAARLRHDAATTPGRAPRAAWRRRPSTTAASSLVARPRRRGLLCTSGRLVADRLRTLGAIVGAAALAFLVGAPYTVLDLPAFLDGFARAVRALRVPAAAGGSGLAALREAPVAARRADDAGRPRSLGGGRAPARASADALAAGRR